MQSESAQVISDSMKFGVHSLKMGVFNLSESHLSCRLLSQGTHISSPALAWERQKEKALF